MAVALDTQTRFPTTDVSGFDNTTGTRTFSVAANANAKGAVVIVFGSLSTAPVTGALYGGTAMSLIEDAVDTTEAGRILIFFLGDLTGLGGTQTVTLQGADGNIKFAICFTVTAATSTTAIVGNNNVDTTISTNPSMTVVTSDTSILFGGVHGGDASPTSYAVGANYLGSFSGDYGQKSAKAQYRNGTVAAGSITYNFTFGTSDDWCLAAVAVAESSGAPPATGLPYNPVLPRLKVLGR